LKINDGTGGNTATDPADPTTQWNYPANWQEGQPPSPTDTPLLPLANAGYVNAASCVVKGLRVDGPSADGALRIADGADVATASGSGVNVGLFANGRVIQTGGSLTVNGLFRIGADVGGNGSYLLEGGTLTVAGISEYESIGEFGTGVFTQTGGTHIVQNAMYVGRLGGNGVLNLGGGTLRASSIEIQSGTLNITSDLARIEVANLFFGLNSRLTAVPGASIHMIGSGPWFWFSSREESALAELEKVVVLFDGVSAHGFGRLEAASVDRGATESGFLDNFVLGTVVVGAVNPAGIRLMDYVDNGNRVLPEAVYLHDLIIGPDSTLDLAGLHLYYDGSVVNNGAIIGGSPVFVPEPGTLCLMGLGSVALLRRRLATPKRQHKRQECNRSQGLFS
jgi:hypothetical protein